MDLICATDSVPEVDGAAGAGAAGAGAGAAVPLSLMTWPG